MIRITDYNSDARMMQYLFDTTALGESPKQDDTTESSSYKYMRGVDMGFDLKELVRLCNEVTSDADLTESAVRDTVDAWPEEYKTFVLNLWKTEGGSHMRAIFPTKVLASDCGFKGVGPEDEVYQPDWSTILMLTKAGAHVTSPLFKPKGKRVSFYFADKAVESDVYVIATRPMGVTCTTNSTLRYIEVDNESIMPNATYEFWQNVHMGLRNRGAASSMNKFMNGESNRIFLTVASEHSSTKSYCVRDIVYNGLRDLLDFEKPSKFTVRGLNQERFYPCKIKDSLECNRIDYCQVEVFFKQLGAKALALYNNIAVAFGGYDNAMKALQQHKYADIKLQCTLDAYWNSPKAATNNYKGGVWSEEFLGSSVYVAHKRWLPFMEVQNG